MDGETSVVKYVAVAVVLYLYVGFLHWLIAGGWRGWHFMLWWPVEYVMGWRDRRRGL